MSRTTLPYHQPPCAPKKRSPLTLEQHNRQQKRCRPDRRVPIRKLVERRQIENLNVHPVAVDKVCQGGTYDHFVAENVH